MTLPTQLTYAFPDNGTKNACWYFVTSTSETRSFSLVFVRTSEIPGNGAKNACWYFVASTSEIGSFSLVPVKALELLVIGANNASTFHIAITENHTIMNHESFCKRTESPMQYFTQRVFQGVIYISTGKAATKFCRYAVWTNLNGIFKCMNSGKINMDEGSVKHKQTQL